MGPGAEDGVERETGAESGLHNPRLAAVREGPVGEGPAPTTTRPGSCGPAAPPPRPTSFDLPELMTITAAELSGSAFFANGSIVPPFASRHASWHAPSTKVDPTRIELVTS